MAFGGQIMNEPVNKLQDASGIQKDTATNVATSTNMTEPERGESLNREMQDALGRRLQQVYGQLVAEPLPNKVMQLLAKLASEQPASGDDDTSLKKSGEGEK